MAQSQNLIINPTQTIVFEGNFANDVTKHMTIKNPFDKNVAFKVKTTTPRQFCVRPNTGLIFPKQTFDITIILQPLQIPVTKNPKFMIEWAIVNNSDDVWKSIPISEKIMHKLSCSFIKMEETAPSSVETSPSIGSSMNSLKKLLHELEHGPDENFITKYKNKKLMGMTFPFIAVLAFSIKSENSENTVSEEDFNTFEFICDQVDNIEEQINNDEDLLKGWRMIHFVASFGNAEMLKVLIDRGCDITCETGDGYAPLALATEFEKTKNAEFLQKILTPPPRTGQPQGATSVPLCDICDNGPKNTALNCGHVFCRTCANMDTVCFFCRTPITARIKLFM